MEIKLSKREQKRQETLNKLLNAMNEIIEKYDYDTLTIRNICGVSSGSFYNLFENKEKFLTYYLTHDFISYKENYYKNNKEFDSLNYIDKSIDIFVTCAKYNQMKGLKVTVVGDAKQVRNGLSAIYEGYMAGYNA